MNYVLISDLLKPVNQVHENLNCLLLRQVAVLSQKLLEVSLVTELADDIGVVRSLENIVHFEAVDVVEFF